jgi:hypothetical protein
VLYSWTTYPLTCLIQAIWKHCSPRIGQDYPDLVHVELCSIAERALNYMHTGNVAVISTTSMNPLWVGHAIIQDGLPSFNHRMVTIDTMGMMQVGKDKWPSDPITHQPRSSAATSQMYVYNHSVAKVSHHNYIYNTTLRYYMVLYHQTHMCRCLLHSMPSCLHSKATTQFNLRHSTHQCHFQLFQIHH